MKRQKNHHGIRTTHSKLSEPGVLLKHSPSAQCPIWGLSSSSVWQENAPTQLIPHTPLLWPPHNPGIAFTQERNIPDHTEPASQRTRNVSSSLQSQSNFWQYPFILIFFSFLTLPWQMIKASKTASAKHYIHIKSVLLCWRLLPWLWAPRFSLQSQARAFKNCNCCLTEQNPSWAWRQNPL